MRPRVHKNGFTLLEVLVSLAIFGMIIVMMGNLYHQSSIAWDSGTRKAQGAIEARVILANIANELSHAVQVKNGMVDPLQLASGTETDQHYGYSGTHFEFISLAWKYNIANATQFRDAHRIIYEIEDDALKRTEQKIYSMADYTGSGVDYGVEDTYIVATNVADIQFITPIEPPAAIKQHIDEALPRWVTVRLQLGRTDEVSGVAAVSSGPNKSFEALSSGDSDDIRTY